MSDELNKEQDPALEIIETAPQEPAEAEPQVATVRKNDPWKTAFIVLAGISVISAGIFYIVYAKKGDLPTTAAYTDPNAQPVQMANPPTGLSEQAALSQPVPQVVGNAADMSMPGAGGYDPWANPGRFQNGTQPGTGPYQVYPTSPPGQQMYMDINPNSPFMQDGNTYVMVPAGNTAVNANKAVQPNANKSLPMPTPTPATVTPPAGNTAPPTQVKPPVKQPDSLPANKPVVKPTVKKPSTGKPNGTE